MSALGQINDKLGVYLTTLTQADSFPYDTSGEHIIYISITNDGSAQAEFTLTYRNTDKGTGTILVPVGKDFSAVVNEFTSIDVDAGDGYKIALYGRGVV